MYFLTLHFLNYNQPSVFTVSGLRSSLFTVLFLHHFFIHWISLSSSAFNCLACSFTPPPMPTTPLPNPSFQLPHPLLPLLLCISFKLCFAFLILFLFLRPSLCPFICSLCQLFLHLSLPGSLPLSVVVCMSWLWLLWILSCNRQCAVLVSDVCMTCFPPDPISSSQPACLPACLLFLG